MEGDPSLKPSAVRLIERMRSKGTAVVSVISVWEIALLVRKKRLELPFSVEQWVKRALELPGIHLQAFTPQIAIESVQLPDSLNRDPSDRILIATARTQGFTLMTRDKDIIRFAKQTNLAVELA